MRSSEYLGEMTCATEITNCKTIIVHRLGCIVDHVEILQARKNDIRSTAIKRLITYKRLKLGALPMTGIAA